MINNPKRSLGLSSILANFPNTNTEVRNDSFTNQSGRDAFSTKQV